MEPKHSLSPLIKLSTGIEGFDLIAEGGLPMGRTTLVAGTAGSAKTVFAAQFLAEGIRRKQQAGVFVTFEEPPADIRRNLLSMSWDIEQWEKDGLWAFVDASPLPGLEQIEAGDFDLGALLARIEHAIHQVSAKRVAIDSLGAVFSQFTHSYLVREEMRRLGAALRNLGITAVMTAERTQEFGEIARFGVEEFVADNVVILRNVLEDEKRRRTVEILKFRGTTHQKGEYPFTVLPDSGIVVIPVSAIELKQRSSDRRVSSGNPELDRMTGGGFFQDSLILVSGATGCGKTLMTAEFIAASITQGERCLLFAYEESREQLFRNARGWGYDFNKYEQEGLLQVICAYPETAGLEDHLIKIKSHIDSFKPRRVAVDSVSALERVATSRGFREFIISLASFVKQREIPGMFTATTANLMGGPSITESHFSSITDTIILLRYVEMLGEMRRGITVLKMRGSMHEKEIREFTIDGQGMHINAPFRNIIGILSGRPEFITPGEMERMGRLFND
ncbi:circadian clock protein KaiC [Candidatus Magnetaquicoccus inordinatus]|uniref:circadian clock protein KaiC n=1 Tax=Candidatus Magnetaquicoccus inordinatus TaxID=2496818 RepID=UPI00102CFF4E|nr:circadian clock protein KaiC [Candidatus Magnetaquicoccus inordinatus]